MEVLIAGTKNDVLVGKNADFSQVGAPNATSSENNGLVTDGKIWIGSTALNAGGTHINVGSITSPSGSLIVGYNSPNITIDSARADLHVARFIVGTTANGGNFTTIASAIAAANAGDTVFIQTKATPYTENLTLKAGVNLAAFGSDSSQNGTGLVVISGTLTMTTAGTVSISGIQLQTNGAALLAVTGSAASVVNLDNCYLNCTNATGITFSSSNASSGISIKNCVGNLGSAGIAYFTSTGAGAINSFNSTFTNSANSSTASTTSVSSIGFWNCITFCNFSASSTGSFSFNQTTLNSALNTTPLTTAGTGISFVFGSTINSGTASSISVGSGTTVFCTSSTLISTNTNVITGAGTIEYSGVSFFYPGPNNINATTTVGRAFRPGITMSSDQPAFLGYLAGTVLNKTGSGATYTLGTDALTEVFDQNGDFVTSGTFTAPFTGKYFLAGSALLVGNAANVQTTFNIVTSNRTYSTASGHGSTGQNTSGFGDSVCDMDSGDTATFTITASGEAGNTADVFGSANAETRVSGYLIC